MTTNRHYLHNNPSAVIWVEQRPDGWWGVEENYWQGIVRNEYGPWPTKEEAIEGTKHQADPHGYVIID